MNHTLDEKTTTFGLLACATSGCWTVDLDESSDGSQWSLALDGPTLYLAFTPLNLSSVHSTINYLRTIQSNPLLLGHFGSSEVTLHWDNESAGRLFVIVKDEAHPHAAIRATLSDMDVRMLAEALEEVFDQLQPVSAAAM